MIAAGRGWFGCGVLRGRPRLSRAALVTVLLLLAVDLGVARRPWLLERCGTKESSWPLWRCHVLVDPAPDPAVVVLGSSMAMFDASPAVLAASLGVPREQVLNLAVPGGSAFDSLTIYRLRRERLRHARVIVVGFEDLNAVRRFAWNASDRRYAGWADRVTQRDLAERPVALLGWVWRTLDVREALRAGLASGFAPVRPSVPLSPDGRPDLYEGVMQHRRTSPAEVEQEVRSLFADARPTRTRFRQLGELLALARADGVRVVVVAFPLLESYRSAVRRLAPTVEPWYDRLLREVPGVPVLDWRSNAALALTADQFHDHAHLTNAGAARFSAALGQELRRRYPECGWPAAQPLPPL